MTTWAIGDVQGCHDGLCRLLEAIEFDPDRDSLWFVGDLVNRGGQSLEVLRLLAGLGPSVTAVLGNHDLHLLRRAAAPESFKPNRELDRVIEAPDGDALVAWLRERPFLHRDDELGAVLVHAGIHPTWTLAEAERLAERASGWLRAARTPEAFAALWGAPRAQDSSDRRFVISCFTRMRALGPSGALDLAFSGPADEAPPGRVPWFAWPGRAGLPLRVYFGHWAALGYHRDRAVTALDTGYVWGGSMTAVPVGQPGSPVQVSPPRGPAGGLRSVDAH